MPRDVRHGHPPRKRKRRVPRGQTAAQRRAAPGVRLGGDHDRSPSARARRASAPRAPGAAGRAGSTTGRRSCRRTRGSRRRRRSPSRSGPPRRRCPWRASPSGRTTSLRCRSPLRSAVFSISAISTKVIEIRSAISSSFVTLMMSAAIRTRNATAKWMRMFRCVRRTWMIPSNALLNESMIVGDRRAVMFRVALPRGLPFPPVVVAEQVQQTVGQRPAPVVADDLRAEHHVAERARHARGEVVAAVDREREHVGRLVDPEVVPLQGAHLVEPDERDPELTVVDPLCVQHAPARARPRRRRPPRRRSGSRPRPRSSVALVGVLLVGLDDALHELVADDVLVVELDELDAVDLRRARRARAPGPTAARAAGRSA